MIKMTKWIFVNASVVCCTITVFCLKNPHLKTLNIGCNQLGEAGVQHLRSALGGSGSSLRMLGLQNTQMTCQGAVLLKECRADNSTLLILGIILELVGYSVNFPSESFCWCYLSMQFLPLSAHKPGRTGYCVLINLKLMALRSCRSACFHRLCYAVIVHRNVWTELYRCEHMKWTSDVITRISNVIASAAEVRRFAGSRYSRSNPRK
ncbi:hypothetical protein Y032_0370g96 [Ancylostoma ceylanicum]|uniref:Leucine Rich repeat-containing domain protein n=1 Tax=Ancylostoma ceylanicum TaxID=53326 RepID=A0A016RUD5_9BILA|nr:hypothetical protein Y032_0370g96 [Ancylostoma ceylanicum]